MIKIALNFKSQGAEKLELLNLGSETLAIADYECIKIFRSAILHKTLLPKKDNAFHKYSTFE